MEVFGLDKITSINIYENGEIYEAHSVYGLLYKLYNESLTAPESFLEEIKFTVARTFIEHIQLEIAFRQGIVMSIPIDNRNIESIWTIVQSSHMSTKEYLEFKNQFSAQIEATLFNIMSSFRPPDLTWKTILMIFFL